MRKRNTPRSVEKKQDWNQIQKHKLPPDPSKVEALKEYIFSMREHVPCGKCKQPSLVDWYDRKGTPVLVNSYADRGVAKWRMRVLLTSTWRALCRSCAEKLTARDRARVATQSQAEKGIEPPPPKSPELVRVEAICNLLRVRAMKTKDRKERMQLWRKHAHFQRIKLMMDEVSDAAKEQEP